MTTDRISRTYPDLAGKKVCKTCDFCVKPNMWQSSGWECKAPQNVQHGYIDKVSGDWVYINTLCTDARKEVTGPFSQKCGPEGNWYQIDPYIPVNGIRHIDRVRMLRKSTERVSIKGLTLDDIL